MQENFDQKLLLTLIGAIIGFLFSQTMNLISYLRRPKFDIPNFDGGVKSRYSGDPPEVPAEIDLGFYLENNGFNTAINTRIFVSTIETSENENGPWEETSLEFSEIEEPINIIPPNKSILVSFAKITSREPYLKLRLKRAGRDDLDDFVQADTRGKKYFKVEFVVVCDDKNSNFTRELIFKPGADKYFAPLIWKNTKNKRIKL